MGAVILSVIIIIPALIEGIGFTFNSFFLIWPYILSPWMLYLVSLFPSSKISFKIPIKISILVLLFLLFAGVSTFAFSLDKQISIEQYLLLVALFLIFIYGYSNRATVSRTAPFAICTLGLIFIFLSLIWVWGKAANLSLPVLFDKQLIFPYYKGHNHLGDYLGMFLILLPTLPIMRRIKPLLFFLFFGGFILMIASNSRSAYISFAFAITAFLFDKRDKLGRRHLFTGFILLLIVGAVFFASSSQYALSSSPFYTSLKTLSHRLNITPRDLWSGREVYYNQALKSIQSNPLFGIGGGNFVKASRLYNTVNNFSDSAHNLLLETAVEYGLPASILFFIIGLTILISAFKQQDARKYALLYLLINFLFGYVYKIHLFLVITAYLAGSLYNEKREITIPSWLYGIPGLALFSIFTLYLTSTLLLNNSQPLEAIRWYPYNKDAYIEAIRKDFPEKNHTLLIADARSIAPDDLGILLAGARIYIQKNDKKNALVLYQKIYDANRYANFEAVIKELYALKKELQSKKEANRFLSEVAHAYKYFFVNEDFKKEFAAFCIENRGTVCNETDWYW